MATRSGKQGAGLDAGIVKKGPPDKSVLSKKPLPSTGTPPWPKSNVASAGDGKHKFK